MSKQKAHWALTIKEECYLAWSPKKREEFDYFVGKYIQCQGERMQLPYDKTNNYILAVGLKEKEDDNTSSVHWHCLFSCQPGKTCTAGRVRIVMGLSYMPIPEEYLQPLDTNPMTYMKYANKTSTSNRKTHDVDGILRDEFNMLKKRSVVSKDTFLTYLCEKYGATWITKNKTIIDMYCSIQEQCYAERIVVDVDDDVDIAERVKEIISSFHDNVLTQIKTRGHLHTKADALNNVKQDDIAKYITFISLVPYMFQRAKNAIDYIPGLYFWGDANAGKSFIFQMGKAYRTIATDSVGVGKFKLETCEAAFLLDDVRGDAIDTGSYISTLRQLTLGAYTRVKIHSETRQIKGFVSVTSNEKPCFLEAGYDEKNRNAWLRRFIVLEFKRPKNMDELIVNGNEFEYRIAQETIAPFMLNLAKHLRETYGENHRVYKSIHIYKRHLHKYIALNPTPLDVSIELPTQEDGPGPNLDITVGHFDQPKIITAANILHPRRFPSIVIVDSSNDATLKEELKTNKRKALVSLDYETDSDGFELSNGKRIKHVEADDNQFMR